MSFAAPGTSSGTTAYPGLRLDNFFNLSNTNIPNESKISTTAKNLRGYSYKGLGSASSFPHCMVIFKACTRFSPDHALSISL